MFFEYTQGHGFDAFLVVAELGFVFFGELDRELPKGGLAAGVEKAADQQRLLHVAHSHVVVDEVLEFCAVHGEIFARRLGVCWLGRMRSDTPRCSLGIGVRRESLMFCVQPRQRVYTHTSSVLTLTVSPARRMRVQRGVAHRC